MSMEIKARDLIAAGWKEGPGIGSAVKRARFLAATGLSREAVLQKLDEEFPKDSPVLVPRGTPAPLAEAIVPETPEEMVNVTAARARMTELLEVPVIKRGALMPDACPSGSGRAYIPVGGAIETDWSDGGVLIKLSMDPTLLAS